MAGRTPTPGASPAGAHATPSPSPHDAAMVAAAAPGVSEASMTMGQLLKAAIVRGHPAEAKRVANEWISLCAADTPKAIYCVVEGTLELAGIPSKISVEDVQGNPDLFLEQLPESVRERNLDLSMYSFSMVGGRHGRRSIYYWERFWSLGLGSQNVGDILEFKLTDLLERWLIPMSHHGIRTVRHVATVGVLAMAQALGQHIRELTKQLEIIGRQLEVADSGKKKQTVKLDGEIKLLDDRIKILSGSRQRILESTIPHRNRDLCENIRLYCLSEVDRLIKQEPAMYLQQKWTARVFLMIHDRNAEVRLKALTCIASWFDRIKKYREEVKEHLLQFAERCMLHLVERTVDVDTRVACKAIQMLRHPVLAERMTDEEVEKIVNLVSKGTDIEVRQEAALFVNAQVFQDPGICVPEGRNRRKRRGGALGAGRDRERDDGMSELSDVGEDDEDRDEPDAPDNIATLLNSETSISMFIEYLENYMGQSLRLTDRAVNAFWHRAPCLSYWTTMVSLMILGESSKGPGLDPVSTRQRLILLHIMEAAVRRATEDVKKAEGTGGGKDAISKMDNACNTILPELPRLFELCYPEEKQVLIVSHICKMLIEHAESKNMKEAIWNCRPLTKVLKQCILNRGFMDVVKHCTDSILVISVFVSEVRGQFIEVAKKVNQETVAAATAMLQKTGQSPEDLRSLLGKFNIINQRGIDMSFGNAECLAVFFDLLRVRVDNMRKWQEHCVKGLQEDPDFKFTENMPDVGHVIYLMECCTQIINWYFRFCHWEHNTPDRTALQELDSLQAGRIKETRAKLPKVFLELRNVLCALMQTDGSPHVKIVAFSSYMMIMQVAVGVSESLDVHGDEASHLPPGQQIKSMEDLKKIRMPTMLPEHQQVIFKYLNELFTFVQAAHAVPFDDEGNKVEPHDIWPSLALQGEHTAPRHMLQELLEGRADITKRNDFEAEDGDKAAERQLFRSVIAAKMVLDSEIEDVHAGPIGQLLLTQLDRSKPKPLREVALRLKKRLRDLARINSEFALQYFEVQKSAVIALYAQVGADAARGLACEFARQWGPRLMPWLENPLHETLLMAIDECGTMGEDGATLLDAFGYWVKGDEFASADRRSVLKEKARRALQAAGVDPSASKFIQRCDSSSAMPLMPLNANAPQDEADVVTPSWTPGKRLFGKQTVARDDAATEDGPGEAAETSREAKRPRTT